MKKLVIKLTLILALGEVTYLYNRILNMLEDYTE